MLDGHTNEVDSVAISANGQRGVSSKMDQTVRLWLSSEVPEGPKSPGTVTLTASDLTLMAGETRGVDVRVKRKNTLAAIRVELADLPPKLTAKPILVPGASETERIEFFAAVDAVPGKYTVRLQPSVDGSPIQEPLSISVTIEPPAPVVIKPVSLDKPSGLVFGAAISGNGKRAVSVSGNTSIRVWDLETNKELHKLDGHTDFIRGLAVSADGKRAVSGGDEGRVLVWNLDTGKESNRFFYGSQGAVSCVAITPDGKRAVVGGTNKTVRVLNLSTGEQLYLLNGHTNIVNSVAISADGKRAVSASLGKDDRGRVWNLETGKESHQIGDAGLFYGVAISADGKRAITRPNWAMGTHGKTARAWDVDTGKEIRLFEGHSKAVLDVAITANGKRAVSGGDDKIGLVWDVDTGRELYRLEGHRDGITSISTSADGKRIVTSDYGGNVYVWNIPTGEAVTGIPPPPDHSKKLLGKWELATNPALTYEFTADGRFTMSLETKRAEGTYKLAGDVLEIIDNDRKYKLTITNLTDDELSWDSVEIGKTKLKKVKPK